MFRAAKHTRSRKTPTLPLLIQPEGLFANDSKDGAAAVAVLEVSTRGIVGPKAESFLAPRTLIRPASAQKVENSVASALRALSRRTSDLRV
jgi:hypothetical protein